MTPDTLVSGVQRHEQLDRQLLYDNTLLFIRDGWSARFSRDSLYDQTATDKTKGYGLCMVKSSQDKKQRYKVNTHKK